MIADYGVAAVGVLVIVALFGVVFRHMLWPPRR